MDNALPFECKNCLHKWDEVIPVPMELTLVAKRTMRVRCPKCDADHKKLLINWGRRDALAIMGNKRG